MISTFSSFVEFFAAVYVTMAVNNDFCSNFWTPKYYREMNEMLKIYKFPGSSSIHNKLFKQIMDKYEVVQNHAHYRGTVLLVLCVIYLIFMGFEDEKNSIIVGHYVPILYCTVTVGLSVLLTTIILNSWRNVTCFIFACTFLYISLKLGNWDCVNNSSSSLLLYNYKGHLLVLVILMPIIYQLYLYWIYSSIYKGYIKRNVQIEYNRFMESMEGIRTKNKGLVDEIYWTIWSDIAFTSQGDTTLTPFYDVLNGRLLEVASPTHRQLISSWIKFHMKRVFKRNEKDACVTIPAEKPIIAQDNQLAQYESATEKLDFTKEYADYLVWKKSAGKNGNVKSFCSAKNISYQDMRAWLRVNKPAKK